MVNRKERIKMYMGKIIYGVLLLLVVGAGRLCAGQNEWENPEKYEWNKESPHTVFMWYDDELGALTGDFSKSPWHESLNGRWKFSYVPDIEDAEEGFYKKDFDDSSWADLDVPSNWELKGFGEPIIRNIQYVFPANPPYVDVDNPVGTYRKVFTVPEGWDGREVLLHFGSISGYAQVFLNGKRIGMTKAAKTPAEFNVTPYLCEGENLLAVRVYRWHDGSYMEDQDFWRLTGIERDVYLQAYPKSTVWDFFLHAGLDSRYRDGIFNATVDLRAFADSEPGKGQVEMKLVDKTGKTVWAQKRKFEMKGEAETLSFSGRIKNVAKWTAETPELYDCILTLRDEEGNTSVTACKTGFRKIEIKNAKLMVNGMPVYIKGVNRHEHSDTLGHVQTRDLILDDLKQMKRLNINAIRTCHYPNHPDFYDLCDRYGFYVVDEANIENHGMGSVPYFKDTVNHPAYREDWYAAHVDRIDRMVKRDKNHPCVIGWSLGNECGNGKVFHDEYKRLKAYDPSRFVQFEQAWEDWNTDVVCLMYPNMGRIKDYRKSGKYFTFRSGSIRTAEVAEPAGQESFHLMRGRVPVILGAGDQTVNTKGYWICEGKRNVETPPALQANGEGGTITVANQDFTNSATSQRWVFLTADQVRLADEGKIAVDKEKLRRYVAGAKEMSKVPHHDVSSDASASFTSLVNKTEASIDHLTSAAEVVSSIDAMYAGITTFMVGTALDGMSAYDLTFLIDNAGMESFEGWTCEQSDDLNFTNGVCEVASTFDLYQTLSQMPKGVYSAVVQGFERPGAYSQVGKDYMSGEDNVSAIVYLYNKSSKLQNIMAGGQKRKLGTASQVYTQGLYIPNNVASAVDYMEQQLYENKVVVEVKRDTDIKLGLKNNNSVSSDWTVFDNFKLSYYGTDVTVDDVTGIDGVEQEPDAGIRQGIYDLSGRAIANPTRPGIYIVNGKKVVIH